MNLLEGLAAALAGFYGRRREQKQEQYTRQQQELEQAFRRWLQMRQLALEQAQFEEGRRQFDINKRFQEEMFERQKAWEDERLRQQWEREQQLREQERAWQQQQKQAIAASAEDVLRRAVGAVAQSVPPRMTVPTAPLEVMAPSLKAKVGAMPPATAPAKVQQQPKVSAEIIAASVKEALKDLTPDERASLPANFSEMPLAQQAFWLAKMGLLSLRPQTTEAGVLLLPEVVGEQERQQAELQRRLIEANIAAKLTPLDEQERKLASQAEWYQTRTEQTEKLLPYREMLLMAQAYRDMAAAQLAQARTETEASRRMMLEDLARLYQSRANEIEKLMGLRADELQSRIQQRSAYTDLIRERLRQMKEKADNSLTQLGSIDAKNFDEAKPFIDNFLQVMRENSLAGGPSFVQEHYNNLMREIDKLASKHKWSQEEIIRAKNYATAEYGKVLELIREGDVLSGVVPQTPQQRKGR